MTKSISMKKNIQLISLFIFLSFATKSIAQTNIFSKVIYHLTTGINGNSICNAYDNSAYIVGSFDFNYPILLKIDSAANVLWSKQITSASLNSTFNVIKPTNDSCFIIAGSIYNSLSAKQDVFLVKINAVGDTVWTREISQSDDSYAYDIQQTADSGFVITGYIENSGPLTTVAFLTKTDNTGTVQWNQKIVAGNYSNYCPTVKLTNDGGYSLFMTFQNNLPGEIGAAVLKFNSAGLIQWAKKYDNGTTSQNNKAIDMDITPGGMLCYSTNNQSVVLMKLDNTGAVISDTTYYHYVLGAYSNEVVSKLIKTSDGNYVLATGASNSHMNGDVMKIDTSGNVIWEHMLNSDPIMIIEAKDSGYTILSTGPMYGVRSAFPSSNDQIGIIKTDSLGIGTSCIFPYPTGSSSINLIATSISPSITSGGAINYRKPITIASPPFVSELGCVTFFGGIEENTSNSVSIFPNPSTSSFTFSGLQNECVIEIYDVMGKIICTTNTSKEKTIIDISKHSKGIYFYRVTGENNFIEKGKISLQ